MRTSSMAFAGAMLAALQLTGATAQAAVINTSLSCGGGQLSIDSTGAGMLSIGCSGALTLTGGSITAASSLALFGTQGIDLDGVLLTAPTITLTTPAGGAIHIRGDSVLSSEHTTIESHLPSPVQLTQGGSLTPLDPGLLTLSHGSGSLTFTATPPAGQLGPRVTGPGVVPVGPVGAGPVTLVNPGGIVFNNGGVVGGGTLQLTAVSPSGLVIHSDLGFASSGGIQSTLSVTTVPEPDIWLMMATGLAALACRPRKCLRRLA